MAMAVVEHTQFWHMQDRSTEDSGDSGGHVGHDGAAVSLAEPCSDLATIFGHKAIAMTPESLASAASREAASGKHEPFTNWNLLQILGVEATDYDAAATYVEVRRRVNSGLVHTFLDLSAHALPDRATVDLFGSYHHSGVPQTYAILNGGLIFDVVAPRTVVRLTAHPGTFLTLPAGIVRRFTVDHHGIARVFILAPQNTVPFSAPGARPMSGAFALYPADAQAAAAGGVAPSEATMHPARVAQIRLESTLTEDVIEPAKLARRDDEKAPSATDGAGGNGSVVADGDIDSI